MGDFILHAIRWNHWQNNWKTWINMFSIVCGGIINRMNEWKQIFRSYVGNLVQPTWMYVEKETTKKIRWNPKEINGITNMNCYVSIILKYIYETAEN